MFAGASVHVHVYVSVCVSVCVCVSVNCCECVCGGLRQRDPVEGTVKDPTLIDSQSKLKRCLYLVEVGGDCRRRRRSTVTQQAETLSSPTHSFNSALTG